MIINFVGDIMPGRKIDIIISRHNDLSKQINKVLPPADHLIANLETPFLINGSKLKNKDPHLTFKVNPQKVHFLKEIGLTVATLANNHITDYGREGVISTLQTLADAGIMHTGAGTTIKEAINPVVLTDNNSRIALLAFNAFVLFSTPAEKEKSGVAWFDSRTIEEAIEYAGEISDSIILSIHWGIDYCHYPVPALINRAKKLFDRFSKIICIVGHHPHLQQPVISHNNKSIFCSLGNFIFDEPFFLSRIGSVLTLYVENNLLIDYSIKYTCLNNEYKLEELSNEMSIEENDRITKVLQKIHNESYEFLNMDKKWIKCLIYQVIRYFDLNSLRFLSDNYSTAKILKILLKYD
jgi:poly-gamma-glutamate synthesis protein (capsule biosynthesis protein)